MNTFQILTGLLAVLYSIEMIQAAEPEAKLTWDSERKDYVTKVGETEAQFSFSATNRSDAEIVITDVKPSCGCTVVSMPAKPWKLAPGASGTIGAKVDLRGKRGMLIKTLSVNSSGGMKNLIFSVAITDAPAENASPEDQAANMRRAMNQQTAGADRQAVFRNDCAACHVQPAVGKLGHELFETACGICHTAEHRASMVPELSGLPNGSNRDYWRTWISQGKEGGLMPAFSKSAGGPLTDEQITSLVEYLVSPESSLHRQAAPHQPPADPVRLLPPPLGEEHSVLENEVPSQPENAPAPKDPSVKD